MQISIHDKNMVRVGRMSNDLIDALHFRDDEWHSYLQEGSSTYTFTVDKFKNGELDKNVALIEYQGGVSFQAHGNTYCFNITGIDEDDEKITFTCENLNLALIGDTVDAFNAGGSYPLTWYLTELGLLNDTWVFLALDETEGNVRNLSWDGQDTKLSRLQSLVKSFDAELEYRTNLNPDGTLDAIYLYIYRENDGENVQGVGRDLRDSILYFGKDIQGVNRTIDKTSVFNAGKFTSSYTEAKTNETINLDLTNYVRSDKNAQGVEEFYTRAGDPYVYAPLSEKMYPAVIKDDGQPHYIKKSISGLQYSTQEDLAGYAFSQLKKHAYPSVTYEVTTFSGIIENYEAFKVGDALSIHDSNLDADGIGFLLQARITEQVVSFSSPENNKLIFSNVSESQGSTLDKMTSQLAYMQEQLKAADRHIIDAVQAANGKNTNYYGDSSEGFPINPKVGDTYFQKDGDKTVVYQWDGSSWVAIISSDWQDIFEKQLNAQLTAVQNQLNTSLAANSAALSSANMALASNSAVIASASSALIDNQASLVSLNDQLSSAQTLVNQVQTDNQVALTAGSLAQSAASQAQQDAEDAIDAANAAMTQALGGQTLAQSVQNDLASAQGEISSAQSNASQALAKFQSLSVGGRNLLRNSGFGAQSGTLPDYWTTKGNGTATATVVSVTDLNQVTQGIEYTSSPSVNAQTGAKSNQLSNIKPNTNYTLSFWVKVNSSANVTFLNQLGEIDSTGKATYNSASSVVGAGTGWNRCVMTLTTKASTVSAFFYMYTAQPKADSTGAYPVVDFTVAAPKLEEGTVPTDWSPAPEDTQVQITTLANGLATTVSQTQYNSDQTALNTRIATVENTYSGITSTVSAVQNITTGMNLLKNSTWNMGMDNWTATGDFTLIDPESDVPDCVIGRVSGGKTQVGYVISDAFSVLAGQSYTLSVDIRVSDLNNPNNTAILLWFGSDSTTQKGNFTYKISQAITDVGLTANVWKRLSVTFTIPNGAAMMKVYTASSGDSPKTTKDLRRYMVTQAVAGKAQTAWSPSMYDSSTTTLTQIQQLSDSITSLTTQVSGNTTNLSTITQTANAVNTKVTQLTAGMATGTSLISQISNSISMLVQKNDVINQINVSTEGILISGNVVHITGQTTIDTGIIKTAMIANAAITNAQIGSLDASKITTGTLSANLLVPTAGNLLMNSEFQSTNFFDGWNNSTGTTPVAFYDSAAFFQDSYGGRSYAAGIDATTQNVTTSANWRRLYQDVRARANFPYSFSALMCQRLMGTSSPGNMGLSVSFMDSSKAVLSTTTTGLTAGEVISSFSLVKLENLVAPANTAFVRVTIYAAGQVNGYVTRVMMNRGTTVLPYTGSTGQIIVDSDLIVNGAILAQHLSTDSVTTDKIYTGAVTANEIAAGTIVSKNINVTELTSKIVTAQSVNAVAINANSITTGSLAANVMSANILYALQLKVSTLSTISEDVGTITAGKIIADNMTISGINASAISTGTFNSKVVYAGTIQASQITGDILQAGLTNKSGNTVRISSSEIDFYDGTAISTYIDETGINFLNPQGTLLGGIGRTNWSGYPNSYGLQFSLGYADFMTWAHLDSPTATNTTAKFTWAAGNIDGLKEGFTFSDNVLFNSQAYFNGKIVFAGNYLALNRFANNLNVGSSQTLAIATGYNSDGTATGWYYF